MENGKSEWNRIVILIRNAYPTASGIGRLATGTGKYFQGITTEPTVL